uniref:glucuronosyltransferase n=1 Tax=Panagrellus redivivus TaxID=6233 RepID=A0A7E4ZW36_PANRE
MLWVNVLSFLAVSHVYCDAAKILVFGTSNSKSHMISAGRIVDVLVKDGHNVTFVNLEVGHSIINFAGVRHLNVVPLGYVTPEEEHEYTEMVAERTKHTFDKETVWRMHDGTARFVESVVQACERALSQNTTTLNQLKSENFDVLITEQLSACGTGLTEVLNIPVHFIISSCALFDPIAKIYGVPTPMGYIPTAMAFSSATDSMSFTQRAQNLIESEVVSNAWMNTYTDTTTLFRKYYGNNFPDVRDIMVNRTPFLFVAVDDLIEFPRPWPPNVIRVGGLGIDFAHAADGLQLSEPCASEMTKGEKGVVFFSMGSAANTAGFPEIAKRNLFETMKNFSDYHFIIKVDKSDDFSRELLKDAPNVFITTWAPQPLLLRHPRLKLFITHGGYNSILEVANCGKPLILLPMMYDQTRNAGVVERNGWGKYVNKQTLLKSNKEFKQALTELLENESYTIAAKRIQKLLQTKPFTANEVFIKHINFAIANNGQLPELMPVANKLNLIQQHSLDVYAVISGVVAVIVLIFVKICFKLAQLFLQKLSGKDKCE